MLKLILLLIITCKCISSEKVTEIVVQTKNGPIRGQSVDLVNKTIHSFIGIRYAQPPTGDLRFRKPVPVANWTSVYNATRRRASCWQRPRQNADIFFSEDCLFLNIWSPAKNFTRLKPVMFYIHGGGFMEGSAYYNNYNGIALAAFDVVVVSINYRVNIFGFLYAGNQLAPGNMGLYDQVLALKWVQDNIRFFGGDPKQITVFGHSAGGMSAGLFLVSPLTRHSIKGAILMSGAPFFHKKAFNNTDNLIDTKTFARKLNCTGSIEEQVKCLKKINTTRLTNLYLFNYLLNIDQPIVGDEFLPNTAQEMIKSGKFNQNVNVIAGVNEDEGTFMLRNYWPDKFDRQMSKKVNKTMLLNLLTNLKNTKKPIDYRSSAPASKVFNRYMANVSDTDQVKLRKRFSKIFGDFIISCPSYFFAKQMASGWTSKNSKNRVRFYKLDYRVNDTKKHPAWEGVWHGAGMPFVFGHPLQEPEKFSVSEMKFSLMNIQMWTNLAKFGNPISSTDNFPKDIRLPHFDISKIKWPEFNVKSQDNKLLILNPNNLNQIKHDEFQRNCDEFWENDF